MYSVDHKVWLDNEYAQWIKALGESTVHNFKEHPTVKRMLGEVDTTLFPKPVGHTDLISTINEIGRKKDLSVYIDAMGVRFVYYAQKLLKLNPRSIVEIGGGVGEFYAILRALGWNGKYVIYDLPDVEDFQDKYLAEVNRITGLDTKQYYLKEYEFCFSAYAWGEFDEETRYKYLQDVIYKCPHGMIIFNPHSGANLDPGFPCKQEPENPLTSPGNLLLTW